MYCIYVMDEQLLHSFIFLPEKAERMGSSQARIHSQARHTAARLFGKVFRKKVRRVRVFAKLCKRRNAWAVACHRVVSVCCGRLARCKLTASGRNMLCSNMECSVRKFSHLIRELPLTQRLRPDHWSHHSHWSQVTPLVTSKWQVASGK